MTAYELFADMGAAGFAEHAVPELWNALVSPWASTTRVNAMREEIPSLP